MSDATDDKPTGRVIVGTFRSDGEARIEEPEAEERFCRHPEWSIDMHARSLTCRACEAEIDPLSLLHEYASGVRLWQNYEQKAREARRLLTDLEAQERRVKARTRAHSRKDAEQAVADVKKRHSERMSGASFKANEIIRLARSILRATGGSLRPGILDTIEPDLGDEDEKPRNPAP